MKSFLATLLALLFITALSLPVVDSRHISIKQEHQRNLRRGGRSNRRGGRFGSASFAGTAVNITCPAPVSCGLCGRKNSAANTAAAGDVGQLVCRSFTGRTGETLNYTKCITTDNGRTGDTCGCCGGVCPQACAATCPCDITARNGTVITAGGGVRLIRANGSREKCVTPLESITKQANGRYTCVTSCLTVDGGR